MGRSVTVFYYYFTMFCQQLKFVRSLANQPLSESISMINRKKSSFIREKKKENLCLNRQNYELSTQIIARADGCSLLIGCLNIFGPNLVWFTIFYIDRSHVFWDIKNHLK